MLRGRRDVVLTGDPPEVLAQQGVGLARVLRREGGGGVAVAATLNGATTHVALPPWPNETAILYCLSVQGKLETIHTVISN